MYKILFVCTGNICRSPTADAMMKKLVKEKNLEDEIFVDSAGTSSYHEGDLPDDRSIACADKYGLDLRCLRSRPIKADDFAEFDLIVAMDSQNIWNLNFKRPDGDCRYQKAKVIKLLEYAPELGFDVPDPYYSIDGFDKVYKMIELSCTNLLNDILCKKN